MEVLRSLALSTILFIVVAGAVQESTSKLALRCGATAA